MIHDILKSEVVQVDVEAKNWQDVVKSAGELLVNQKKIETVFIDSMMDTVKELGPYMILLPDVAFFHGKPSDAVHEPCLSLITLKQPIYFDEFDHQRILCAFAFGAVDGDSHIQILASIVPLLQDPQFIEFITNHGSKEEIMACIEHY